MTQKKTKIASKTASRQRKPIQPNPEATIIKTNQMQSPKMSPKLGAASASVVRTQMKVYSPAYLDSNLNLPRDIRTINMWCRNYYQSNPLVRSAINLHASYTAGKFQLTCKDHKIQQFYEDMLEKINFRNTLLEVATEYWKLGEAFAYAELDDTQGVWDYILVHNPDFIDVPPPNPLAKNPAIMLVPDEALKRIVTSQNPADRMLREQIPPDILLHIQKGEPIPLDNFNVSHLKMLSSPYDTRGVSIIASCFRDLMLFDIIREAKIVQAQNFINPLTLVKLGNENWKPTDDDIRQWQEQVLDSMGDQGYTIVSHGLVDIQKISNSGQVLDMNSDLEECKKNIMTGLMIPSSLFDQEYGSYANSSASLEVLLGRYRRFQLQLKEWIERKLFEPIAKIQDFTVRKNGEEELLYPRVEFDKINLKQTNDYVNILSAMIADPATPGSGKLSLETFYKSIDTDYKQERTRMKLEARDQIVLMKEIQAMQHMDIVELKTLDENTPIQDKRETDSLEQSLDIQDEAADMEGLGLPGGTEGIPGMEGMEGGEGMPGMEEGGGMPGGMPGEMTGGMPGEAPGGEGGLPGAPPGGEAPPT